MAGSTAPTAEFLPFGTTVAFNMGGDDEVWYRVEPTTTGSYKFVLEGPDGDLPYCDVYRVVGPINDPFSYEQWVGWCGDNGTSHEESHIELLGGEVYLIACYNWTFTASNDDFTITVSGPLGPANDRVVNAQVLGPGYVTVQGTTEGGSQEYDEFNDWSGSQAPSVWFKVVMAGPGSFMYGIKSLTPGFHPKIELFYGPGTNGAGPVNGFADLQRDSSEEEVGDGTENPPLRKYDQVGVPGADAGELAPIEGGETFYLRVSSYEDLNAGDFGNFVLTVSSPTAATCLNAADYINGSSPTASVVGGAVRETQTIDNSEVDPFEGRYGDLVPTLVIPGSAIASSPGLYAVSIKTKNNTAGSFLVALLRNGHPLHPGAIPDVGTGETPVLGWLTVPSGSIWPDPDKTVFLNMLWYLPVKPEDTISVIVADESSESSPTIDITEICFQLAKGAVEAAAYDVLDIPDYPLGMTEDDIADGNPEQAGDLCIYKSTAPTYHRHDIFGLDMCVTNDGVIWVLVVHNRAITTSGQRLIGPYLMKWDPASPGWVIVNDDIEGLGVKRTFSTSPTAFIQPYAGSMDTDGEDIWVAYQVDDGVWSGSTRKFAIKVKKYDVSSNTWTTLGTPFAGPHPTGGHPRAGEYEETPVVKVTPGGDVFCAFTDLRDVDPQPYEDGTFKEYMGYVAYVAHWNGSSWDISSPLVPSWFEDYSFTRYQAKDYRNTSSSTTSEVIEDGELCVRDTQTSPDADTCTIIPPAGKWSVRVKVQYNRPSGVGGIAVKYYKNGIEFTPNPSDASASSSSDPTWFFTNEGALDRYQEFNGTTDTLGIRIWRTGTATEVFIDEFLLVPAKFNIMLRGFGQNARFVGYGQAQVALWASESKVAALVPMASVIYTEDPSAKGYVGPGESISNKALAYQLWIYFEWNGSTWVRKWEKLIEDDLPNHVFFVTRQDSLASTPPLGHFQQGMGFCLGPDGSQYLTANLGGGQALFGFFGDAIICCKVDDTGFVAFTETSPTTLGGAGHQVASFFGWSWLTHQRSVHVDANGNVWLAWAISGPNISGKSFIGHAVDTGTGGWLSAALDNEEMGYDAANVAQGILASSPDGSKVYWLMDTYLFDWTTPSPTTLGVWECTVIADAKIPLVPIDVQAAFIAMNWRSSDRGGTRRVLVNR